jgi:hypothetical protein
MCCIYVRLKIKNACECFTVENSSPNFVLKNRPKQTIDQ